MELKDIQGLLIRGHSTMEAASYGLLRFKDPHLTRTWLKDLLPFVTTAQKDHPNHQKQTVSLQIAFTHPGFQILGLSLREGYGFSREFEEGMATSFRSRVLGDEGSSAPQYWHWGNQNRIESEQNEQDPSVSNPVIHALLMVFAPNPSVLEKQKKAITGNCEAARIEVLNWLDASPSPKAREHFGFRDGISQPIIQGTPKAEKLKAKQRKAEELGKDKPAEQVVAQGEFLLGYKNTYGEYPFSPLVPLDRDQQNLLPTTELPLEGKSFGKNGSYLVYRQLKQDVKTFWEFIQEACRRENPEAGPEQAIHLASKMMGRWPDGTPMTLSPLAENPDLSQNADFTYAQTDKEGFRCPIGAHIRRSNPRDVLQNSKPETAMEVSNRHRILRRGRNFGPPLHPSWDPRKYLEILKNQSPEQKEKEHDPSSKDQERGLHFICFNANLSRQFEFVQHSWNNNTKFEGLYDDPDPILGIKRPRPESTNSKNPEPSVLNEAHDFTIQACPLRRKIEGLPRFVHVVGGAYFFMPGLRALHYLCSLENAPES